MYDLEIPRARDTMMQPELTLSAATDLFSAIDQLVMKGAAAAPVLDQNRCLLGMLTEKDCLKVVVHAPKSDP